MNEKYIRFAADKLSRAEFTDIQYVTDDEQGADILATAKSGAHVCIKCVYTDKPVTANAVNEAYQAKKAYGCNAAMVITNSTFTEKAEEFAGKAKVSLKTVALPVSAPAPAATKKPKPEEKRSKLLLAAAIISTVYIIYLINYINGIFDTSESTAETVGMAIGAAMITPHAVLVGIGTIFNWLGWALKARWGALVAGILYAVSIVAMFMYTFFVILQTIFCFVAFGRMKKQE